MLRATSILRTQGVNNNDAAITQAGKSGENDSDGCGGHRGGGLGRSAPDVSRRSRFGRRNDYSDRTRGGNFPGERLVRSLFRYLSPRQESIGRAFLQGGGRHADRQRPQRRAAEQQSQ